MLRSWFRSALLSSFYQGPAHLFPILPLIFLTTRQRVARLAR